MLGPARGRGSRGEQRVAVEPSLQLPSCIPTEQSLLLGAPVSNAHTGVPVQGGLAGALYAIVHQGTFKVTSIHAGMEG